MSNRVTGRTFRAAAIFGLLVGATALSGCSSLGGLGFDRTTTGAVDAQAMPSATQPMPKTLTAPIAVAANTFIPPNDIGGGSGATVIGPAPASLKPLGSVTSEDLPVLSSSDNGSNQMMPAVQPLTPVPATPKLATPAANTLVSIPSDAYVHVIESGESLYTIARRYNVTAQAIIQANGFSSPDKIFVGQKIVIPGRADLLSKMGPAKPAEARTEVAELTPEPKVPLAKVEPVEAKEAKLAEKPKVVEEPKVETAVAKPLEQPKVEPVLSGADKFRWPISGRVITDFANSKGTGINIEAPEGAAVRAAENGQVIYAGSGVEGYGNLILIRHPNGFVSAYAHLKDMNVAKGTVVNRGDNIGTAGKTGSVSKPQLHFELRKGATPVDPIPLLAS